MAANGTSIEDIGRIVNCVLAAIAMAWLIIRRIKRPREYARGRLRRENWIMVMYFLVAIEVAQIEQLLGTGTYFRVVVTFAAVMSSLVVIIRANDDEWPRHRG